MSRLSTVTKIVAASIVTLASVVAQAQLAGGFYNSSLITGFNSNGTGWQVNNTVISSTAFTADVLTLTDNAANEARCAYRIAPVTFQSGFNVSFTYQASGNKAADGSGFIVQNSGLTAIGGPGGGVGVENTLKSVAVVWDMYGGSKANAVVNGVTGSWLGTGSLNVGSGNAIAVTIQYSQATQTIKYTFVDSTASTSYTNSVSSINLKSSLAGSTGWIGFCGATGGSISTQKVSNFKFQSF